MTRAPTAPILALCLAALLLAATMPGARAGEAFFQGLDDLPLMPGLAERVAEHATFDTPAGRIVARGADGPVSRDAVLRFYAETLPQLGWQPAAGGIYTRNGEKLQIEFPRRPAGARGLGVRILITPG
jgi:hypothetical protein